jgi:hypothetical protein
MFLYMRGCRSDWVLYRRRERFQLFQTETRVRLGHQDLGDQLFSFPCPRVRRMATLVKIRLSGAFKAEEKSRGVLTCSVSREQ